MPRLPYVPHKSIGGFFRGLGVIDTEAVGNAAIPLVRPSDFFSTTAIGVRAADGTVVLENLEMTRGTNATMALRFLDGAGIARTILKTREATLRLKNLHLHSSYLNTLQVIGDNAAVDGQISITGYIKNHRGPTEQVASYTTDLGNPNTTLTLLTGGTHFDATATADTFQVIVQGDTHVPFNSTYTATAVGPTQFSVVFNNGGGVVVNDGTVSWVPIRDNRVENKISIYAEETTASADIQYTTVREVGGTVGPPETQGHRYTPENLRIDRIILDPGDATVDASIVLADDAAGTLNATTICATTAEAIDMHCEIYVNPIAPVHPAVPSASRFILLRNNDTGGAGASECYVHIEATLNPQPPTGERFSQYTTVVAGAPAFANMLVVPAGRVAVIENFWVSRQAETDASIGTFFPTSGAAAVTFQPFVHTAAGMTNSQGSAGIEIYPSLNIEPVPDVAQDPVTIALRGNGAAAVHGYIDGVWAI